MVEESYQKEWYRQMYLALHKLTGECVHAKRLCFGIHLQTVNFHSRFHFAVFTRSSSPPNYQLKLTPMASLPVASSYNNFHSD